MGSRSDEDFYKVDLLSDILSNGQSSRIFQTLIKEKNLFSTIDAYLTGDFEPGLFVISSKLTEGVSMETAEKAIWEVLEEVAATKASEYELQKVKNKVESSLVFSEISFLNKAMNIAQHEITGQAEDINFEVEKYNKVNTTDLQEMAQKILIKENCSTLYYHAKK